MLSDGSFRLLPSAPLREQGVARPAGEPANLEQFDQKIDLNSASAGLLEQLPGIGEKTAARIMEYRARNGPFESIEEVMRVHGIGPAKFEQIRSRVTVRPVK